jgi:hypothetical protein
LLPGTSYAVTYPCGKRLVVAFLDKCGLPGVLAVLALKDIHAVFGVLTVLAFGNVHTFGNVRNNSSVLALLDLGIFALLVVMWCNVVIVAFCKQQHVNSDCYVGVVLVLPLHLLFYHCRCLQYNIEMIVVLSILLLWHCNQ